MSQPKYKLDTYEYNADALLLHPTYLVKTYIGSLDM